MLLSLNKLPVDSGDVCLAAVMTFSNSQSNSTALVITPCVCVSVCPAPDQRLHQLHSLSFPQTSLL